MAKVELWWRSGKGVLKFVREQKSALFLVVLEDIAGNLFQIDERNNEVPAGKYDIKSIWPYKRGEERVQNMGMAYIGPGVQTVYLVIEHLMGMVTCYSYDDAVGERYVSKHADKIERPYCWNVNASEKMISDFQRFG